MAIDWTKVDITQRPKIVSGGIVVQRGTKKKIYGGTEERRRVILSGFSQGCLQYKNKQLEGYIRVEKSFGEEHYTTHFRGSMVEGKDVYWLMRQNGVSAKKPENYKNPVVFV